MVGKVHWIECKKYDCRCCSRGYEALRESGEAAGLISLVTVCLCCKSAREHEYQLKRLSRSSTQKKRKCVSSFARSHLKKWQNHLGKLLLPLEKEGLLNGLRVTRRLTLFWVGLALLAFVSYMGCLVNPGRCLLISMGWVESRLQMLIPLTVKNIKTIKNGSYFGCCADLVKELKKAWFDLVAHFPWFYWWCDYSTRQILFHIENSMPGVYASCDVIYRGNECLGNGWWNESYAVFNQGVQSLCTRRTSHNFK